MSNILKDIFSTSLPEIKIKLKFKNVESQKKFIEKLNSVYNNNSSFEITEDIPTISTMAEDDKSLYPLSTDHQPSSMYMGPSFRPISINIKTFLGDEKITLRLSKARNQTILQSFDNEIVFLKLIYNINDTKVHITYKLQLNFAQNIESIIESYRKAIGFFNTFFKDDISESFTAAKRIFQISYLFWQHLKELQDSFNFSFNIAECNDIKDYRYYVEKLHCLLIKKEAIRINTKLNPMDIDDLEYNNLKDNFKINQQIGLKYVKEESYTILGQKINIFTSNFVVNAIIKEIINTSEDKKIVFGDTDSAPMYISCTGFLTLEEAESENDLVMIENDSTQKYINALSVADYYNQDLISIF